MITSVQRNCAARFTALWGYGVVMLLLVAGGWSGQAAPAQQSHEGASTPLSRKQDMVRDRFRRLEDRMFSLRDKLSDREPENAQRLARALERAGALALAERLDALVRKLDDPVAGADALREQEQWLQDVDAVLAILMERDGDNQQRREEIERLEQYRRDLEGLLEQERALRNESARAALALRALRQLDASARRLDALANRQQAAGEAAKARQAEHDQVPAPPQETAAQEQIARDAQQLAEELGQLAEQLRQASGEAPPQNADGSQPSAGDQAARPVQDTAQALGEASEQMKQAAQRMQEGDNAQAGEARQQAEASLEQAREELEKAREILRKQTAERGSAERQSSVADEARALAERMRQADQQRDQQGGAPAPGDPQGGSPQGTPGLDNLDQAEQDMRGAAEELEQHNAEDAVRRQDQAIQNLEEAQRRLDQVLQQKRKEDWAEALRDLETRFRRMLEEQRRINDETASLDSVAPQHFRRAEELQLADVSGRQRALSAQASTCVHILEEDATTIAFPAVIEQLAADMGIVADRLARRSTGGVTQTMQAEIVETLEQLLDAVKRMQQENEQQQGDGQNATDDGAAPLLSASAELKLLRASQLRVNRRTIVIEESRQGTADPPELIQRSLAEAAARQKEVADIAEEIRRRSNQE